MKSPTKIEEGKHARVGNAAPPNRITVRREGKTVRTGAVNPRTITRG